MSSENFLSGMFQPVVLNTDGSIAVAAGYKAKFYAAGTDLPQTIYTDSELQTPYPSPSNIAYLDDTGKALIYLGEGGYKLVLTDPNDVPVPGYTIDNIQGITAFGTGFVNSFAELKDLNTDIFAYTYIGGYFAPGDGGEGMFYNQVSTDASDGGYIQDSSFDPTKKWFRITDENGEVRAASFGYIPQLANADYPVGYTPTTSLEAADSYAASVNATLSIQAGSAATISAVTLESLFVRYESDAILNSGTTQDVTHRGIVISPPQQIFGSNISAVLSSAQIAIPEWFGAKTSFGDNSTAFTAMFASGAGGFKINPGIWVCSALTPPTTPRILSFGLVWDGSSVTFIPIGEYNLTVGNALTVTGPIENTGGTAAITTSGPIYGATLQVVGTAQVGTSLSTGTTITAGTAVIATTTVYGATGVNSGNSISANTIITAGAGGTVGYLSGIFGSSTNRFKASGQQGYAASGTIPIATDALINVGDRLSFVCAGTASGISNGSTFTVNLGTNVLFSINTSGAFTQWSMRGEIIYESSTAISGTADLITTQPESLVETVITITAAPSASQNLVVAAANGGGSGTITANMIVTQIFNM